jgi:hypothetical protein
MSVYERKEICSECGREYVVHLDKKGIDDAPRCNDCGTELCRECMKGHSCLLGGDPNGSWEGIDFDD